MKLTHKIFILSDINGKPVQVDSVTDLMVVVNDIMAFPVKEKAPRRLPLLIEANMLEESIMEAYSILSSEMPDGNVLFKIQNNQLVFEDNRIRFYDNLKKKDIFVKAIDEAFLMYNFKKVDIQDQEVGRQLGFLRSFIAPPVQEEPKEEPKQETEPDTVVDNTPEEPVKEEPVLEPLPEKKEDDLTLKQLEENEIPSAILNKYSKYLQDFTADGYKEYAFKNYRLVFMPEDRTGSDRRGTDMWFFLLTPERVAQIKDIEIIDNASETIKYKFFIDGSRKTLYINPVTGEMSVRRPKRGEKVSDATPVTEETTDTEPESDVVAEATDQSVQETVSPIGESKEGVTETPPDNGQA